MMDAILEIDKVMFSFLNSLHTPFLDTLMYWISFKYTWIPLYVVLIILVLKKAKKKLIVLVAIFASVGLSDICASQLAKPYFERLRPCHDPSIEAVHTVNNKCGKQFGFFSSHASTSASIAFFFYLFFRFKKIGRSTLFLLWMVVMGYSRIYLGVHFPLDVISGFLCGAVIAICFFSLVRKFRVV